ncbi:MAG: sulfatase-like hydrolase/transferase [Planctomycetes bacterium]|nr:sulfatase-like hydrolase/transferase [Planctomycetota bacterium]
MEQNAETTLLSAREERRGCSVWRAVGIGVCVAVMGGALLATLETAAALVVVSKHIREEPLPIGVLVATVGKAAATHTILWLPVMAVVAGLYGLLVRRRAAHPWAALLAAIVLLAGLVVVPADLALARIGGSLSLVLGVLGVVATSSIVYVLVRVSAGWAGPRRADGVLYGLTGACGLLTVITGTGFARSALFDAARYRMPAGRPAAVTRAGPNVLWIVLDTVRADYTSVLGYERPTTPFLERWAAGALLFEHAVANGIWTIPSHASMFTGLSVRAHGMDHVFPRLDRRHRTVAEELTSAGYRTVAFSNNPLISPETELTRGFAEHHSLYHLQHLGRFSLQLLWEKWGTGPILPWLGGDYGAALTHDLVARWLAEQAEDPAPFFLFINYMEAHLPYNVPRRYRQMFLSEPQVARSYELRRRVYGDLVAALHQRFNIEGGDFVTPEDVEVLRGLYAAAIRYLDDRVAEMIQAFEQRGLLDETLVVIVTDHGEHLNTHGMWSHCCQVYDDVIRAALLIREPGRREGRRVTTSVQVADLFPTVLRVTRGAAAPQVGHDVCDLVALAEQEREVRVVFAEYNGPDRDSLQRMRSSSKREIARRVQPQVAATDGRFKYIHSRSGRQELYNLVEDPGELHNLVASNQRQASRFAHLLADWRAAVPPFQPGGASSGTAMSPEMIEALRSLGYLEDQ